FFQAVDCIRYFHVTGVQTCALPIWDILAVSRFDLMMVWGGGAAVLGALALIWRPLLAGTISPEIAAAEGMRPERARLAYMLLLADRKSGGEGQCGCCRTGRIMMKIK